MKLVTTKFKSGGLREKHGCESGGLVSVIWLPRDRELGFALKSCLRRLCDLLVAWCNFFFFIGHSARFIEHFFFYFYFFFLYEGNLYSSVMIQWSVLNSLKTIYGLQTQPMSIQQDIYQHPFYRSFKTYSILGLSTFVRAGLSLSLIATAWASRIADSIIFRGWGGGVFRSNIWSLYMTLEGLINSELLPVLQEASMLPSHSAYLSRNPSLCWCPGGKGGPPTVRILFPKTPSHPQLMAW